LKEIEERGWSIKDLADACTDIMCQSMFYKWLNGENRLSEDRAIQVMDRLDLDIVKTR